jgi:hypothetical protein
MRTDRGEAGWEKTPGILCFSERNELLAVGPVLDCNGMKTLLGPADIHTDDDGTGLMVLHADSRGGLGSRYMFCFVTHLNVMAFQQRLCHCARHK